MALLRGNREKRIGVGQLLVQRRRRAEGEGSVRTQTKEVNVGRR